MKREEKNNLTKEQILHGAMKEFGSKSYTEASLNSIIKTEHLSKGIIYHYFKDKEDLYLTCVSRCVQDLVEYLKEHEQVTGHPEKDIQLYLQLRNVYFQKHPTGAGIFSSFMMLPPKHLKERLFSIRKELEEYNKSFFNRILQGVQLREGVTTEDAMEFFLMFQESFNYYFSHHYHGVEKDALHQHELKLKRILPLLFYGITKEK